MRPKRRYALMRHANFDVSEAAGIVRFHDTFDADGCEYSLTVYPGSFEFTLMLPDGSIVSDSFRGLKGRKVLYNCLESGAIYDWMKETENALRLRDEQDGIVNIEIPLGFARYQISVDRKTGKGWLLMPDYTRGFKLEDIFLQMPDVPMLNDGEFLTVLRDELVQRDIELPETPYHPMLKVSSKDKS